MSRQSDHMASPESTVLLLGNYRPTITVARELAHAGHRVMTGLGGGEGGAEYSRHIAEVWDHPELAGDGHQFQNALDRLLSERPEILAIFPVTEEFVAHFARADVTVPFGVTLVSPAAELVRLARDKLRMLAMAERCGVPCEPYGVVDRIEDIEGAAERMGFPIVIRPLEATLRLGSRKALICRDLKELRQAIPSWPEGQPGLLLQRQATGPRHNVYFAAYEGQMLQFVESRIRRTDMSDGTGLAVDGETVLPSPQLMQHCVAMVRETGYSGIGLFQFIHDAEQDRTCFLELNARVSGSHSVPAGAGLELSAAALAIASGEPGAVRPLMGLAGIDYVWTYGDLRGLKAAVSRRDITLADALRWLGNLFISLYRADVHMTWRLDDPMPAANLIFKQLPLISRLFKRDGEAGNGSLRNAYSK